MPYRFGATLPPVVSFTRQCKTRWAVPVQCCDGLNGDLPGGKESGEHEGGGSHEESFGQHTCCSEQGGAPDSDPADPLIIPLETGQGVGDTGPAADLSGDHPTNEGEWQDDEHDRSQRAEERGDVAGDEEDSAALAAAAKFDPIDVTGGSEAHRVDSRRERRREVRGIRSLARSLEGWSAGCAPRANPMVMKGRRPPAPPER